jgi:hypothetical protein
MTLGMSFGFLVAVSVLDREKCRSKKRVVRLWHVAISLLVLVLWVLPLGWFNFYLVRHGGVRCNLAYALIWLLSPLTLLLHSAYFRTRPFELELYEQVGVRSFKKFMLHGDYYRRHLRRIEPAHARINSRRGAQNFLSQTIWSEKAHLMALVIGLAAILYALKLGLNRFAGVFFVSNILFNIYPIMLQRYTRARISRLLER